MLDDLCEWTVLRIPWKELNNTKSPLLQNRLKELVEQGRHHLIIDLSEVEFMSSSGIGALISSWQSLCQCQGSLHLVTPSTRVLSVLQLIALDDAVKLSKTIEEAILQGRSA